MTRATRARDPWTDAGVGSAVLDHAAPRRAHGALAASGPDVRADRTQPVRESHGPAPAISVLSTSAAVVGPRQRGLQKLAAWASLAARRVDRNGAAPNQASFSARE